MIPGCFPILAGGSNKQVIVTDARSSATASTSYSFTNVSLGAYDPTRVTVLAIHWFRLDTTASLSSATIGANTPTSRVSASRLVSGGSGSYVYCDLRTTTITGTSATVSLSFNRAPTYGCVIGVWALYNVASQAPVSTAISDTNGTFSLTTQPDDLIVAAATSVYDQTIATWTNATENYQGVTDRMISTGALRQPLSSGSLSVDVNFNSTPGAQTPVGVAGVWR